MTSVNFMLAIDREVVNSHMSSPMEALSMLFASYFVCNIEYSKEAAATIEFVQWYDIFNIDQLSQAHLLSKLGHHCHIIS